MGQKLDERELALYRAVDEVLHYVWDPIGVSGVPQARDEYRAYLPQVFSLLSSGATASAIAAYLSDVVTQRMGLTTSVDSALEVAEVLLEWKALHS